MPIGRTSGSSTICARRNKKPGRIADLNQLLVEALNSREIDDLHLAAPEPVDWMYIRGFRFSSEDGNEVESDPKISKYLASRQNDELSLDDLKVDQLLALRAEDDAVAEHGRSIGRSTKPRSRRLCPLGRPLVSGQHRLQGARSP